MTYALSFSERFFLSRDSETVRPSPQPTCVYQALLSMRQETWDAMVRDVFGGHPAQLDALTVLEKIRETDTCSNLDSPVQVWIDPEGRYDVLVYDEPPETRDNTTERWHCVG